MAETTTSPVSAGAPAAKESAASGGGRPDPKGELGRLKDLAQKNQAELDRISNENALVRQNIAALEAGLGEVDQIVKAYTQSSTLVADQTSLQSFVDKQMSMALAAIGSGKAALDAIVTGVDAGIEAQHKLTTDLQSSSDKAEAAQSVAVNTAKDKQAEYDTAKKTLSRAQATMADLKALRSQVTSAAEAGNFGAMYILLGEMKGDLNRIAVPAAADLHAQLSTALSDLHAALSDVRDKKQACDAAAAILTAAQKKLNETKLGRRASLIDTVKNWKAPAAPAAHTPPATQAKG